MNTEELLSVVRRISLMAQKNAPLRLAFAEGQLTVSAQTPDVGEASDALPVPFAGEPLEIGFNPEFLIARPRERRLAGRDPEADQPAAPRPARERRRQRLPLPHHAHPPERLMAVVGRLRLRDFRSYEDARGRASASG